MTSKQSTKKGGTKGKTGGSKTKAAKIEAEAEQFKADAVAYAQDAYNAALAHYEATERKPGVTIFYKPWEVDAEQFEQYRQDGAFFSAIIATPDCPEGFRKLFDAVWSDDLLGRVVGHMGGPYLLPLTYAIVRDVMDASNLCGTAGGIHDTLIKAVEALVPDEIADRAREVMKRGKWQG
jgi:hypothetical protein